MAEICHLAQINVARLLHPEGDERVAEFFANLDRVNALAEQSDGFVWRLKEEAGGNATGIAISPDPNLIVNMSVWRDAEALFEYVYRSAHTPMMAKRRQWFDRASGAYQALWWVEAGHVPTFKARFPAPGLEGPPADHKPDPWCVGNA